MIGALLVFCLAGSPLLAQPSRTFVLGDQLTTWESGGRGLDALVVKRRYLAIIDTTNTPGDAIDFDLRRGWITPLFFDPDVNIAQRVLSGGSITAPNAGRGNEDQLEGTVNEDHLVAFLRKPTFFEPNVTIRGVRVILDFDPPIGVHRVRFYPRNTVVATPSAPFQTDFLRGYEILLNIVHRSASSPDVLVGRSTENDDPIVDVEIPDQYARFVTVKALSDVPFEIDEIEVYGRGFLQQSRYLSDVIDLGSAATIGPVAWVEDVIGNPLASSLSVRMRTGIDPQPLRFAKKLYDDLGALAGVEDISPTLYWTLEPGVQEPVTEDLQNWSPWTPLRNGQLIQAPNPRQYVQFRLDFSADLADACAVDELSFDYLQPPIADGLVAEVFPRLAQAEEPATFRYAVRLQSNGNIRGFDRLEVDTNVEVTSIREVSLNGEPLEFDIDFIEPLTFGLSIPLIQADDSLLKFTFDLPIFRFGTTFSGRAYHSDSSALPQALRPGDATEFGPSDFAELSSLSVAVPKSQIGTLVGEIQFDSRVITPNGDGVHDELRVFFNLLQLTRPAQATLMLFDLAGRRVVTLFDAEQGIGPVEVAWNGIADNGNLVLPGNYVWTLEVHADAFTERHQGVVGVAF
ncbi:MAG TPA: hypothetical protein DIC52_10300 [Candidatus Latescibacteria bacterium]|nr:hypothetical protein [Candidatus Latescibacterota bacterium]